VTDHKIKTLLFLTVLVVAVLPLVAALYFLDRALQTSLNLGFNQSIVRVLENGSRNLKTLRDLDPAQAGLYREQFEDIEELRHIYADPQLVKSSVLDSLKIYFALGLAAAVAFSVIVAMVLSRKIARGYQLTFDELLSQREKVRYLEEMSSWQELAKVLAHEIKNPLTPIEVLVTSLVKSFDTKNPQAFREQLTQTQTMIGEELDHLKHTVNKFSDFARLPAVQTVEVALAEVLAQQLTAIETAFEGARIELDVPSPPAMRAKLDPTLFRQVLTNIIRNGVEANPGRRVNFNVRVGSSAGAVQPGRVQIEIENDGAPVPPEIAPRMFDPYISGKTTKDNMGLGLAIVKKILIEHGGEVMYVARSGRPIFVIALPMVT
jgi:signal transduction histidine kinase